MAGPSRPQPDLDYDWDSVRLTPLEDTDVDAIHQWQNSPDVRDQTMGFRFPVQKEAVKDWLKGLRDQNGRERIVYAIRRGETLVGTIQLNAIDHFQRKAALGIFIGDAGQRNAGVGYVATALILDYAFNGLDLRKVGLEVIASNAGAVRLYEKLGFVREGTKRQEYFVGGRCEDTFVYGLLREEFAAALPAAAHRLVRGAPQP
jgi:UDP-4-amino-4,6-dideoxy-N-acetyl-beta-L-altrosamine N-acetyltransferase